MAQLQTNREIGELRAFTRYNYQARCGLHLGDQAPHAVEASPIGYPMRYRFKIPDVCLGMILVLCAVLCTAIFASAQQRTLAVTDVSGMGSPVTLFGMMVTTEDEPLPFKHTLKKDISYTNLSSKSILFIISKINVSDLTNDDFQQTKIDEYFFADHVFNSKSTEVLEDSSARFGESTGDTKLEEEDPTATAEVVFVQFVDGSTWATERRVKVQWMNGG